MRRDSWARRCEQSQQCNCRSAVPIEGPIQHGAGGWLWGSIGAALFGVGDDGVWMDLDGLRWVWSGCSLGAGWVRPGVGGLAARTDAQVFGVGVRRLASLRRATNREHIAEKLLSPDSPLFSDGRFVRKKQRPSLGLPGVPRRLEFPHRRPIGPMASDSATVGQPFASLPPSSWPLPIRQHTRPWRARVRY